MTECPKRFVPTTEGRWYGKWGNCPPRWFDVRERKVCYDGIKQTVLVTDLLDTEGGGMWNVGNYYFEWIQQPTTEE